MVFRLAFFALMALGLLGFGTVVWVATRPPPPDAATLAANANVTVLVAAHSIRAGVLLKPEDLLAKDISVREAGDDSSLDTSEARAALSGAMVRRSLGPGDVVRMKDVMRQGDHGFLAAVLGPNMRAVSIGVDVITGAAGLIWPGDRIDVVLTQAIGDNTIPLGRRVAAETVLSDVRVIAIDQQLVEGAAPDGAEGKARTVTIEVTAAQVERISVATRLGRLSLSVRSADRTSETPASILSGTTWASDVSSALGTNVAQGNHNTLHVFTGTADGKEFRF